MEVDVKEQRAVVKFFFLDNKSLSEIHENLLRVYGGCALSLSTVKYWIRKFKRGNLSINDDP